ncbi:MAG: thiamine pyrophosphate-binding protein [Candidatus Omnitrophica bacterium]|jgi:acetolactate synthase-1/2/3 large subunit|nr:thiamine pyrophosphate-binding protein [Candidatus Omnitrophota bacterium]
MAIKVSDYIAKYLVGYGVKHIFMITGGGAMHLNNSFGRARGLKCIFHHHEQACAIAAEGYARVGQRLAVVNVTSGPGGLNALTGVMGQWTDSVPVLYISGQVKTATTIGSCPGLGLRQLGDQEVDIISIVRPITKFAISIRNPKDIKRLLDKAIYIATSGRPGPVWLDIPLDVQGALVEESRLPGYNKRKDTLLINNKVNSKISRAIKMLKDSQRPVLIAGHGIRIAGAQEFLPGLIEKLGVPVLTTFNGFDLVPSDNRYFIGRIGTFGSRAGNFALQNADLVLSIGSRNNIRQVSYNWNSFAHSAKKIIVDIDPAELKKPTIRPDLAINCDAGYFLKKLFKHAPFEPGWNWWLNWCRERKDRYPVVLKEYQESRAVNPYYFIQKLTQLSRASDVIVAANASACVVLFQAGVVKKNQRILWNSGCASMGYDLPAAIGASLVNNAKNTICISGDGSIQMNIQELQTIAHYKLPVKIFLLNNQGYVSIKQTQENFFGLPYIGCDPGSGVSFPSFSKVAKAYGIKAMVITGHRRMEVEINRALKFKGPLLCDVVLEKDYKFAPRLSSQRLGDERIISKSLEDMAPFLSRKELQANILQEAE